MWLKRLGKTILLLGGAATLLATGATLALFFAATPTDSRVIETGSVTLGAPATTLVSLSGLVPGASALKTYSVTYTGNAPAWLGLIASVSGDLSTCDSGKLQMHLADEKEPAITYRWNQPSPEVIRTGGTPEGPIALPVTAGTTKTFRVGYTLPLEASNDCQSKAATIQLQVVAVQSEFNTNAAGNGPISWGTGPVTPPPTGSSLDQANSIGVIDNWGHLSNDFGQIFRAGRTGALTKVRLPLYGPIDFDVPVTIQSVVDGLPSGTILASTTVHRWTTSLTMPELIDAEFTAPATVTAGTQYAIVIGNQRFLETAMTINQYDGGHALLFSGTTWLRVLPFDLFFETYVQ